MKFLKFSEVKKSPDEILIDLVKQNPHLYDKQDPNFKDKVLRTNSWTEIANILEMTVQDCITRWTRLRERYSKDKKLKERHARSGNGTSPRTCFSYHKNMQFLDQHIKPRRSLTKALSVPHTSQLTFVSSPICVMGSEKISTYTNLENCAVDFKSAATSSQSSTVFECNEDISCDNGNERYYLQNVRVAKTEATPVPALQVIMDKDVCENDEEKGSYIELSPASVERHLHDETTTVEKDECDHFGAFIAAKLKKLRETERNEKILELMKILLE